MSWKICLCTDNNRQINQHFGTCTQCAIYEIEPAGTANLLEQRQLQSTADSCSHDDSLRQKIASIADCDYVLCEKIGNHALRALAAENITALEYSGEITTDLQKLAIYLKRLHHLS